MSDTPLQLVLVQYNPIIGDIASNIQKVDSLLEETNLLLLFQMLKLPSLKKDGPRLIVLPEMSLTVFKGYLFKSIEEITPFVEPTPPIKATIKRTDLMIGTSIRWACEKGSYVLISFPETVQCVAGLPNGLYNSSAIIGPQGVVEHVYRKHFLFDAEEHWALPGSGFSHLELSGIGRVGVGICMDLNHNTKVEDSFSKCEFAKYHAEHQTSLILIPMNWLKSGDSDDLRPSIMVLLYWITRLRPLIHSLKPGQRVYVAACNRVGFERGTTFTGSSCVLELSLSISDREHNRLRDLIKEQAVVLKQLAEDDPYYELDYDEMLLRVAQGNDLLDKVRLIDALPISFEGLLECSVFPNQCP